MHIFKKIIETAPRSDFNCICIEDIDEYSALVKRMKEGTITHIYESNYKFDENINLINKVHRDNNINQIDKTSLTNSDEILNIRYFSIYDTEDPDVLDKYLINTFMEVDCTTEFNSFYDNLIAKDINPVHNRDKSFYRMNVVMFSKIEFPLELYSDNIKIDEATLSSILI
jgi:hypothetical protein